MENLSNEVLLKIFSYLEDWNLLSVIQTCSRYQSLVESTQSLMKKFTVVMDFENIYWNCKGDQICEDRSINAINRSERPYQNLCLQNIRNEGYVSTKLWEQVDESLRKFSPSLTNLKFHKCKFDTTDLLEMLSVLPNLQKLEFNGVLLIFDLETELASYHNVHKLKNLKELEISNSIMNEVIFQILIHVENLQVIRIVNFKENLKVLEVMGILKSKYPGLERFLCQQKSLKTLDLVSSFDYPPIFCDPLNIAIKFQLKNLTLQKFEKCYDGVLRFLSTQKQLEKLSIDVFNPPGRNYDAYLHQILSLENLVELNLHILTSCDIKYNIQNFSIAHRNDNLKILSVTYQDKFHEEGEDDDSSNEDAENVPVVWTEYFLLEWLTEVFPNVEKFKLVYYKDMDENGQLKLSDVTVFGRWKKLREFEVKHVNEGQFLTQLALSDTLERFKGVMREVSYADYEIFLANNKNLKDLDIEVKTIDNSIVELITRNLKYLERISISSFCYNLKELNQETVLIILNNCQHLKYLNLELPNSCEQLPPETQNLLITKNLIYDFFYYRD